MNTTDNVGTHGSCVRPTSHQPNRKSVRADFHDYSGGDYFVTICTRDKEHYFGKIRNGEMILSGIGSYCQQQLEDLTTHYYASVLLFVVMPNHIHAIIRISNDSENKRTHEPDANQRTHEPSENQRTHEPSENQRTHEPCVPTVRTALSVVIGGLKRAVTLYARRNNIDFDWQSRYHDHIIRGPRDGNNIAEYIENNVARWGADCYNPERIPPC